MTCGFMQLATLQFEWKLQKCIRMGITIFKIFIWGGISSDIPPQMKVLNMVILYICNLRAMIRGDIWEYSRYCRRVDSLGVRGILVQETGSMYITLSFFLIHQAFRCFHGIKKSFLQ